MVRDKDQSVVLPNASWRTDNHADGRMQKNVNVSSSSITSKLTLERQVFYTAGIIMHMINFF